MSGARARRCCHVSKPTSRPSTLLPRLQTSRKMAAFVTVAPVNAYFGTCRLPLAVGRCTRSACDCQAFSRGGVRAAPPASADEAPSKVRGARAGTPAHARRARARRCTHGARGSGLRSKVDLSWKKTRLWALAQRAQPPGPSPQRLRAVLGCARRAARRSGAVARPCRGADAELTSQPPFAPCAHRTAPRRAHAPAPRHAGVAGGPPRLAQGQERSAG